MKALLAIWVCVLFTGTCSVVYVNSVIDSVKILPDVAYQLQPAQPVNLGNVACLQACNEPNIQPANALNN